MKLNRMIALACSVVVTGQLASAKIQENKKLGSEFSEVNRTEPSHQAVVSKAVLYGEISEGKVGAICVIDTAGRPGLVPSFLNAAPSGFQSSIYTDLRVCNESETRSIAYTAEAAIRQKDAQFAALPAAVVAGIVICSISGIAGTALGSTKAAAELNVIPYNAPPVDAASIGLGVGIARGVGAGIAVGVGAGIFGYICGSLGDTAGYFGLKFLLEK